MGHGHLVRTTALARFLVQHAGAECQIFSRSDRAEWPFPAVRIPESLPLEREAEFLRAKAPEIDVLIADLYRPTQAQITAFRRENRLLVFLDDRSPLQFDCDILVNPNLSTQFVHTCSAVTDYLRADQAILLRPEFAHSLPHPIHARARRLLLCSGGSDPRGITDLLLSWLGNRLPAGIEEVLVVRGGDFPGKRSSPSQPRFRFEDDVRDMAEKMKNADAGILAAGTLLYEAAATGLPSLFLAVDESQQREAEALHARGAGIYLGRWDEVKPDAFFSALGELLPEENRRRISRQAQLVVTGVGLEYTGRRIIQSWQSKRTP
jgi:spore coat polysaccharide biosynthesis predicted glycosyltransferase SpsG